MPKSWVMNKIICQWDCQSNTGAVKTYLTPGVQLFIIQNESKKGYDMKLWYHLFLLCGSIAALIFFPGCVEKQLNVTVGFYDIQGLKKADHVIFQGHSIGKVDRISFTENGRYLVDISILPDFKNAATEHSQFYIADDPIQKDQTAVEIKLLETGGSVLSDGARVDGMEPPSGSMDALRETVEKEMDKFRDALEKGVGEFRKDIDQLAKELRRMPESEEFKAFTEKMERLAEEMKKSGKDVREKLQNDFLPKLWSEMDKLRKKLNDLGREDEMKQLDKKAEQLKSL